MVLELLPDDNRGEAGDLAPVIDGCPAAGRTPERAEIAHDAAAVGKSMPLGFIRPRVWWYPDGVIRKSRHLARRIDRGGGTPIPADRAERRRGVARRCVDGARYRDSKPDCEPNSRRTCRPIASSAPVWRATATHRGSIDGHLAFRRVDAKHATPVKAAARPNPTNPAPRSLRPFPSWEFNPEQCCDLSRNNLMNCFCRMDAVPEKVLVGVLADKRWRVRCNARVGHIAQNETHRTGVDLVECSVQVELHDLDSGKSLLERNQEPFEVSVEALRQRVCCDG